MHNNVSPSLQFCVIVCPQAKIFLSPVTTAPVHAPTHKSSPQRMETKAKREVSTIRKSQLGSTQPGHNTNCRQHQQSVPSQNNSRQRMFTSHTLLSLAPPCAHPSNKPLSLPTPSVIPQSHQYIYPVGGNPLTHFQALRLSRKGAKNESVVGSTVKHGRTYTRTHTRAPSTLPQTPKHTHTGDHETHGWMGKQSEGV